MPTFTMIGSPGRDLNRSSARVVLPLASLRWLE